KKQKCDILLVQVYVDDIIFGSTNKELCKAFEKLMRDKFQMSLMGELTFFLGLQVKQKDNEIFISQDKYIAEILRKFGLTDVKRIFRYLKGKPHLGLWYPKDSPFNLVAYSDSDYARASLDRKFIKGSCQFLDASEGFDQIVNFLNAHMILYALMVNPIIYVLRIKQFWNFVSIKKSNDVVRLQALIDRKKVIITEDSIRQALRLDDANAHTNEIEEEGIKRKGDSLNQDAAKKQKIDEETEELKTHLQIVANDDDDVYTEATPLALNVPVVDYQVHHENNKPYYKLIRADGTHQLFLSFITLLKNFDRKDLEMLWEACSRKISIFRA
nr:retrotransposon protein, putative, Ty1-copia subclass [Tanacetum cinerariifolium]